METRTALVDLILSHGIELKWCLNPEPNPLRLNRKLWTIHSKLYSLKLKPWCWFHLVPWHWTRNGAETLNPFCQRDKKMSIYIYILIHVYVYVYVYTYMYVCMYVYIHIHICIYIHVCIYIFICVHKVPSLRLDHSSSLTYTHIHIHMHAHAHIYTHVHMHAHTHTHTYTQSYRQTQAQT